MYHFARALDESDIANIYDEGELMPEATVRKFRTVQNEGNRQVGRDIDHYTTSM